MVGTTYKVKFKRRQQQKTNYPKRLGLLKSGKARMVFRKSNKQITVQLVEYKNGQDYTLVRLTSKQLEKFGWLGNTNMASCYLLGYWFGKQAQSQGCTEAILDTGMLTSHHGGKIFAA